jgi:hypothetical protein
MYNRGMNVINHASHRIHERYCLYLYADSAAPALAPPAVDGLAWTILSAPDVTRLLASEPRRKLKFQHFLSHGSIGVCVSFGDEWAAHLMMSTPGHPRPHVQTSVAPRAYWLHTGATKPEYRGKGLLKFMFRVLIGEAFRQQSAPELILDTTPDIVATRHGILSTKCEPAGMLYCTYLWLPKIARLPLYCRWERGAPHPAMPGGIA